MLTEKFYLIKVNQCIIPRKVPICRADCVSTLLSPPDFGQQGAAARGVGVKGPAAPHVMFQNLYVLSCCMNTFFSAVIESITKLVWM